MPDTPAPLPERLRPDPTAATQATESGLAVYRASDRIFLELDEIGAEFWDALEEAPTTGAAVDRLLLEFDIDRATLEADLARFAAPLLERGLLRDEDAAGGPEPTVEERLARARDRYLDLLERHLLGQLVGTTDLAQVATGRWGALSDRQPDLLTLVGSVRLRNVRHLVTQVLERQVPGDLMECGVWRGGVGLMMRAVLAAHEVTDRCVWLADSFAGLPTPDVERFPLDAFWAKYAGAIAVDRDQVAENFRRAGLLDHQVRFLEGWFRDTLPTAPVERLAVLRLDGDLYESTTDALHHLYDRVSPGGFVIVDDYVLESCRAAVDDFRAERGITAAVHHVDWTGVFWQVP